MTKKYTYEELGWKFNELENEVTECKTSEKSLRENLSKLRKERDFYQEAISAVCQPFYAIDVKNYKILMANSAAINLFGDHIDNPFCYSWTHGRATPCSDGGHVCPLEIIKNKKKPITVGHTHYDKKGRPLFFKIHAYPLFDAEGNVTKIIEYSEEITKIKRMEYAQRESEERYREIIENAHDIIQSILPDGSLGYVNRAWHEVLGYTDTDLKSIKIFDIVHPDSLFHFQELFSRILQGKSGTHIPLTFLAKDGEQVFVEGNVSPRLLEGKVVAIHVIFHDVTESKKADAALKDHEEKYRKILESIEEGYYEVDRSGKMTFFNDSMCRIFGYPENELLRMNPRQYMEEGFYRKVLRTFNRVYLTAKPEIASDWHIRRKDGVKRWIEASISLRTNIEGQKVGFRGIVRDVTERKVAEEKIAEYSKHLEQIIAALNVAQEVQQSLLPTHLPKVKRLDIAGCSLYCDETGGDYYDYIELPHMGSDVYGIIVGDVSGHGVSAALQMASVRAYLRGRVTKMGTVAEIITDVNRLVSTDAMETAVFMTLFFLKIEACTGRLSWVRAGHDPALIYSPDLGHFEKLEGKGLPLGVDKNYQYRAYTAVVKPGQLLILATDGIWENRNTKGEMFGRERLKELIRRNADMGAEGIKLAIIDAVRNFLGEAKQDDDITLVILKFL
jgi:sigma-B regulation protein RsbU (phosphoserine phosphatase)